MNLVHDVECCFAGALCRLNCCSIASRRSNELCFRSAIDLNVTSTLNGVREGCHCCRTRTGAPQTCRRHEGVHCRSTRATSTWSMLVKAFQVPAWECAGPSDSDSKNPESAKMRRQASRPGFRTGHFLRLSMPVREQSGTS